MGPPDACLQVLSQPSPFVVLPSSQVSPAWMKPSPHTGVLHASVQVPVLAFCAPRSHCSPVCMKPSPHTGSLQASVQAPVLAFCMPMSHCSPVCTKPSP